MLETLSIAIGASVGAILRNLIAEASLFGHHHFYLRILLINVLGSATFGFLLAALNDRPGSLVTALIFTGFLGSFTTFSAFSHHNHHLILEGRLITAFLNIIGQVSLSLLFFYLCFRWGRMVFHR